jgi:ribonucleoside-diphosphate reductase alpha chain
MYFYAWKKGLKTTYYLRSRPATRIAKTTVEAPAVGPGAEADPRADRGFASNPPTPLPPPLKNYSDEAAVACSLENPESCEACQ